jgi:hypothetical protein
LSIKGVIYLPLLKKGIAVGLREMDADFQGRMMKKHHPLDDYLILDGGLAKAPSLSRFCGM